jgi:prefoldin subunit 2
LSSKYFTLHHQPWPHNSNSLLESSKVIMPSSPLASLFKYPEKLTLLPELQNQYSSYKSLLQQLAQKIGDVEQEAEEHKLVLETLTPLPGTRKCFRMINGVLIERTVDDVVPVLKTNSEGLGKVLEDLVRQYKGKQEEMEKWKVCSEVFPRACLAIRGRWWCCIWLELMLILSIEKEQYPGRPAVTVACRQVEFRVRCWVRIWFMTGTRYGV